VLCLIQHLEKRPIEGEFAMGDTGKKDKGKKEQKKKAKLTILEKRKQKHEKKNPTAGVL